MRSRWFHPPTLHTALDPRRRWSWLAIFYDLLFAAAVLQLGSALSASIDRGEGVFAFARVAGHFVPLWLAWSGFTFFENRFDVDDFLHRALVFLQMLAVGAMAVAAPAALAPTPEPKVFSLAAGVALMLVGALNARAHAQVEEGRGYTRYWGLVFTASGGLWAVAAFVPRPWCYLVWAVGSLAVLGAPLSAQSRALTEKFPLDFDNLSERYGLLTVVVLGESFVEVLAYLAQDSRGADPGQLLKGALTLLIAISIWWIYFDDVAGSRIRRTRGSWIIWLYGHLPMAFGITALGAAIKKAITLDLGTVPDSRYGWFVAGALGLTFLSVGIIDSVTERRQAELSDRWRVNLRFASALLMVVVAQLGTGMTTGVFLAVITAICIGQVIFDMVMVPLDGNADVAATSVAELARRRASGEKVVKRGPRRDIAGAVRVGAPADLRRDLYFFFIEGSWTRMLMTLGICYLVINFVFAGAYLLEPASIGVTDRSAFLEAFSFSVQTMSTIGYGAIFPKTPYGDLVVAIEAAVGLLSVALATGLMFAKASLPRSSVLFSDNMIISRREGVPTLMFRCGNARGNEVVEAQISVAVIRDEVSAEGHHLRRVIDLPLVRNRSPVFTLSWTVMHVIDEDSPIADIDWTKPDDHIVLFIATMLGHDATYGTTTHARHVYYPEAIRDRHRFVDVIGELDDGRMLVDYTKFHDTFPDDDAPSSA
jgi:inward rectifier potassium channel